MVCTFIAFVALAQADRVTFTLKATPITEAVAMLEISLGTKLTVLPYFAKNVVIARVHDSDPKSVLNHLAESMAAKWEKNPQGGLILRRDSKAELAEKKDIDNKNLEIIIKSQAYLKEQLAAQPANLTAEYLDKIKRQAEQEVARQKAAMEREDYYTAFAQQGAEELSPAWRAAAGLMINASPNDLMKLPNRSRTVYSTSPTAMQRDLNGLGKPAITRYLAELKLAQPKVEVKKIRFFLSRWETTAAFNVEFQALNADGAIVDKSFIRMNNDSKTMKVPFPQRDSQKIDPNDKPIETPDKVLRFRAAMSQMNGTDDAIKDFQEMRPMLLDPITYEPSSYGQSVEILLAAEMLDKNVIGVVCDLEDFRFNDGKRSFAGKVLEGSYSLRKAADGWLIARPAEEITKWSRPEAKTFINECVGIGGIRIDDAAKWTAQTDAVYPWICWVGDYLDALLGGGRFGAQSTLMSEDELRLWWAIGQGARDSLRNGATLDIANLAAEAKQLIYQAAFWTRESEGKQEITEALPNGISGGTMKLQIEEQPIMMAWNKDLGVPSTATPVDAKTYGVVLVRRASAGQASRDNQFRMGVQRTYNFNFELGRERLPLQMSVSESFFDPNTRPTSSLDTQFQVEAEKSRIAEMKRQEKIKAGETPPP